MTIKQNIYLPIKRLIDIVVSLISLVILSPLLILIALAIMVDTRGPFLFKQKRIGIDNSEFNILKFRTMQIDAPSEAPTDQLSNATSWITRTGKILRKTSLDELPQLINIFKGEMSIVGPRPALWNQYNLNDLRTQAKVHSIKPGLTGLAQINGRDENDDEEKVFWDREYLNSFGFIFDLMCISRTITTVFSRKGVLEGGNNDAEKSTNNG